MILVRFHACYRKPQVNFWAIHYFEKEKGRAVARRAGGGIAERGLAPAWVRAMPPGQGCASAHLCMAESPHYTHTHAHTTHTQTHTAPAWSGLCVCTVRCMTVSPLYTHTHTCGARSPGRNRPLLPDLSGSWPPCGPEDVGPSRGRPGERCAWSSWCQE